MLRSRTLTKCWSCYSWADVQQLAAVMLWCRETQQKQKAKQVWMRERFGEVTSARTGLQREVEVRFEHLVLISMLASRARIFTAAWRHRLLTQLVSLCPNHPGFTPKCQTKKGLGCPWRVCEPEVEDWTCKPLTLHSITSEHGPLFLSGAVASTLTGGLQSSWCHLTHDGLVLLGGGVR